MNGDAGRDYMLGDEGTLTRDGSSVIVTLAGHRSPATTR